MRPKFIHNEARYILAKLHIAQYEGRPKEEINSLSDRLSALYNDNSLSDEVILELDVLSALLNGPVMHCVGSGAKSIGDKCLICNQEMQTFNGAYAEHGVNAESEPGFLDRVLDSCGYVKLI